MRGKREKHEKQIEKKKQTELEQEMIKGMEEGLNNVLHQVEALNKRDETLKKDAEKQQWITDLRERVWIEECERQKIKQRL